jgi:radical SAM/Cys-rich protein
METSSLTTNSKSNSTEEISKNNTFISTVEQHGLVLNREETKTLQINTGLLCNQVCRHCHLDAGPDRDEIMDLKTVKDVLSYASRCEFDVFDITGGAPELNPHIPFMIKHASSAVPRIMIRSNLSALNDGKRDHLFDLFKDHKVAVVASFPSFNKNQLESQRGKGIFEISIAALKRLNSLGYGDLSSDLELNLISNPTGAFLPSDQSRTEDRFRDVLKKKWGIKFTKLFNFANVPLGRFRKWLIKSGNLDSYINKLASGFNPCAIDGVMCRTLVSVSWDGFMYDCDFNLARGIPLGGQKTHVTDMNESPTPGSPIAVADHCYSCTAGSGFT